MFKNKFSAILIILLFPTILIFSSGVEAAVLPLNSVVKVYTVASPPNYHNPWQNYSEMSGTGSGCIIDGNRILTSAHVVRDQTFIMVRKQGNPQRYPARLVSAAYDCDLAILTVDEPGFFDDLAPIPLGELPHMQDAVTVLGYPYGGDNISITKGVVSRIEPTIYAFSGHWLLCAQIDAAINPGNSGGPVIKDGKLVGIAFQGLALGDNMGFMVPVPIIQHFLNDIEDGDYGGFPALGILFQRMENPALRDWVKMKPDETGIMVTHIMPEYKKTTILKPNDVILEIDGTKIANDGTINLRENENIIFSYLLWEKYVNDTVNIKVLRDGKVKEIKQILKNYDRLVPERKFDAFPEYFIFGGLVFVPLSTNYIDALGGFSKAPIDLAYLLQHGEITKERDQVVILSKVLADNFNIGYQNVVYKIVEKVNGKEVKNLKNFIDLIENTKDQFITITLSDHSTVVLDTEKGKEATPRILKRYRIDSDRSEGLKISDE